MGARMAMRWKCQAQASEAKGYELLCAAAEQLRSAKRTPFSVECTVTEVKQASGTVGKGRQVMSQIEFSDKQDLAFLILGSAGKVVTTSPLLASKGGMLEKMTVQPVTAFKRGIRFEGLKFALGDFVLSCAQASSLGGSKHFIGVIAEVEYLPTASITAARLVLEEFLSVLYSTMKTLEGYKEGTFSKVPSHFAHFGLSDQFSLEHAAVQYILVCKALAK